MKYSKYEVWQRKAAQRLRRGVPAILRAKKFRGQAEKIKAQEQAIFHRPLISLPSKLPPVLLTTDNYVNHKWARCQPFAQTRVWREKKRLGDYSFVSDVISVAVHFDLPCPVRAHQSLPLLSSTTSWPPAPFLMPAQPHPPPPPAHKHAFTFFLSELFRSLSLSVTDTKGTNTNDEQKVNNLAECNSGGSLSKREKRREKRRWKRSVVCKCQEDTQRNVLVFFFFCPCGRQLKVKSSLHERIHSTSFFLRQKENLC